MAIMKRNDMKNTNKTLQYIYDKSVEDNSMLNLKIAEIKESQKNAPKENQEIISKMINHLETVSHFREKDSLNVKKEMEYIKQKNEHFELTKKIINTINKFEENDTVLHRAINDKKNYENLYNNIFDKIESIKVKNLRDGDKYSKIKKDFNNSAKSYEMDEDYEDESDYEYSEDEYDEMVEDVKIIPEHLKPVQKIDEIISDYANKYVKQVSPNFNKIKNQKTLDNDYNEYMSLLDDKMSKKQKMSSYYNNDINKPLEKKPELFEKKKFLEANLFMKIGHVLGLSLRNKYYKNLDEEVQKALNNNELYRVLEAQKNGYYLGKKLNKLTIEALYKELTTNPLNLIEELVKRDVMLSFDQLSLVLLSNKGQDLITGNNLTDFSHTKELYLDLIKKENFLYANKNLWLKTLSDKELFLKEENPLFYHEKMLSICDKSELTGVKNTLEKYLQTDEVLKSISKNKLIDKMLLKINLQLGNSIELEHMVLDLPELAQKLFKSIKEIKFSDDDIKILQNAHQFEYELVDKRLPEAIMKYVSVDINYRDNLKNNAGKTAENLLIETLENILITKKDLNLLVNQYKLSDLSVTKRYTASIRGDIGKPSLVTLKTVQQLRDSGELNDLVNETIVETINHKNSNESSENNQNNETIPETKLAINSGDVRIAKERAKKLRI